MKQTVANNAGHVLYDDAFPRVFFLNISEHADGERRGPAPI